MTTFETPAPVLATVEMLGGDVRIVASDRADTVVELSPESKDVEVDFTAGRVRVKAPKPSIGFRGKLIDVTICLPTGSRVEVDAAANVRCEGSIGPSELRAASGNVTVEQATGELAVYVADGNVTVQRALGYVDANVQRGNVRVGVPEGLRVQTELHTDYGRLRHDLAGEEAPAGTEAVKVRANTSYGDIVVHRS